MSLGKLCLPPEHTHSNQLCTPGKGKYRRKLNKALCGPFMGSCTPGALKEEPEQGTEEPRPHRSCRVEVQHRLWCHSVSAPRGKCQEVMTGTVPFQGCPTTASRGCPGADPLPTSTETSPAASSLSWNQHSLRIASAPRHCSTQEFPAPAQHKHWHNHSPTMGACSWMGALKTCRGKEC